jgi:membrane protein
LAQEGQTPTSHCQRMSVDLLKKAFKKWGQDRGARTAAALAFFTVLSLSPTLLLSLSVAGIIYSGNEARARLISTLQSEFGQEAVQVVTPLIEKATQPGSGVTGSIVSLVFLGLGASGLFGQLEQAFNDIWKVPETEGGGIKAAILAKLASITVAMVAAIVLLLSISLSVASSHLGGLLELPNAVVPLFDHGLSLLFVTAVVSLLFKKIPRVRIQWSDVATPAFLTTVLFLLGKIGLSYYFAVTAAGSAYGAAGSLIVILLWLFYLFQILFLGAEYCYVYTHEKGSLRVVSNPDSSHKA